MINLVANESKLALDEPWKGRSLPDEQKNRITEKVPYLEYRPKGSLNFYHLPAYGFTPEITDAIREAINQMQRAGKIDPLATKARLPNGKIINL